MSTIRFHLRAEQSGKRTTRTLMDATAAYGPVSEQGVNTYIISKGENKTIDVQNGAALRLSRPFKLEVTPTAAGDSGSMTVLSKELAVFMFPCQIVIDYPSSDTIDLDLEVTVTLF